MIARVRSGIQTRPLLSMLAIVRFAQRLLLQHVFRRCCSVHRFLIGLAAASCLCAPPMMAIPAMDDLELRLQGEAKGWLDATCTYYGLGWLTPDQGRKALKRLTLLLEAHYLDPEETERAKSLALLRDP